MRNPGLIHLAENICDYLDDGDLIKIYGVSKTCQSFIDVNYGRKRLISIQKVGLDFGHERLWLFVEHCRVTLSDICEKRTNATLFFSVTLRIIPTKFSLNKTTEPSRRSPKWN